MSVEAVFPNGLYPSDAVELLWPVGTYVLGMALYAVFVFKFYRFVAARDMFALRLSRYEEARYRWVRRLLHSVMYVAKYLIVFPAFAFFWFAVLTLILAFLSKGREIADILLIALATVTTIRVAAYYNEDLSRDVAKILPFAVLALFVIDASFFDVAESLEVLRDANDVREHILYYLLFLVVVEFTLRLLLGIVSVLSRGRRTASNGREDREEEPSPEPTIRERLLAGAAAGDAGLPADARPTVDHRLRRTRDRAEADLRPRAASRRGQYPVATSLAPPDAVRHDPPTQGTEASKLGRSDDSPRTYIRTAGRDAHRTTRDQAVA